MEVVHFSMLWRNSTGGSVFYDFIWQRNNWNLLKIWVNCASGFRSFCGRFDVLTHFVVTLALQSHFSSLQASIGNTKDGDFFGSHCTKQHGGSFNSSVFMSSPRRCTWKIFSLQYNHITNASNRIRDAGTRKCLAFLLEMILDYFLLIISQSLQLLFQYSLWLIAQFGT